MLDQIIPFRYLRAEERDALAASLQEHTYERGDTIVREGDDQDDRMFLLVSGSVEIVEAGKRLSVINAGHYFGERAALFEEARQVSIVALEPARVLSLAGDTLLDLVRTSRIFAQTLGDILRDKQGIFVAFDRFMGELKSGTGEGTISLARLLPLYQSLHPALHKFANSEEHDFSALSYAVRRLPENLTRTVAYYLTETLPEHYGDPNELFDFVPTAARRHAVFELFPGKDMVLIRDGRSDIIDLVSCLCVFVIEARKIRRRLQDDVLIHAMSKPGFDPSTLPFSEHEWASIVEIWPDETTKRLGEIVFLHEDIRIEIHRQLNNYNSAHAETWSAQMAQATRDMIGRDPSDLPDGFEVHIISSNTHSVPNCLSPWLVEHRAAMLAWAKSVDHIMLTQSWEHESDTVYAIARDYFRAHPEQLQAKADSDLACGIVRLKSTAFTGVEAQLIDIAKLTNHAIDPGVAAPTGEMLIINIDYAFGQQAEHLVANLLALFGNHIKSINVLGKAGGLTGARGDILVATSFIEQTDEIFQPLPGSPIDTARLAASIPDRDVHIGPVLTVAGTLLQNPMMLQFNKHFWGCVGLEMEGTYYFRKIQESINRGVIEPIDLRFMYYISDLPLDHGANLSGRLRAAEGIPPLYAITREVLTGIFSP